jgi:hypothetical protein
MNNLLLEAHRLIISLVAIAIVLAGFPAHAQLTPLEIREKVIGKWKVVDVMCPSCALHARSEIGSIIELNNDRIKNEFGGDCTDTPGYTLLRKITLQKLLTTKGKSWPSQLKRALRKEKSLLYGYITCGGGNHMRMIFTPEGRSYYFWEGDTVFVLKRSS